MKAAELRELSVEELQARLGDLAEESFNLRFQHTLGQLSSPIRLSSSMSPELPRVE